MDLRKALQIAELLDDGKNTEKFNKIRKQMDIVELSKNPSLLKQVALHTMVEKILPPEPKKKYPKILSPDERRLKYILENR